VEKPSGFARLFSKHLWKSSREVAEGHRLLISMGAAASTARSRFLFWIENRGGLKQNFSRQDRL
jgi:hypothetical protein